MREVLELLESDARLTAGQIATMLGRDEEEVARIIKESEEKKLIQGYFTLVDWDKLGAEKVSAVIEVKISPQRDVGFDAVAERIYRFPEVRSVRLMSGAYDLIVMIEGGTMKEVAHFVSFKLASMEYVLSTATHFVLKTYKHHGVIIDDKEEDRRQVIMP
ncbi:Lrp/AsnC family transcriptional regulator [Pelotomaculum terephthalicicum JT]|uniref:Lrp/AsnC family transcriptional regulator n=1 Tax=Pelotomaculum terephthalicicum TaxID=206393 RepID=UPI001F036168|nr:Lrp/AsnC family transcriptional regulator [Pelotomaculum terephthalicicum]MCG9967892.1 Lrp/AsnC family transcriptional regulator [Pelotomaculum terephthalicicum JT]